MPLYVTVSVPVPTGVAAGSTAAIRAGLRGESLPEKRSRQRRDLLAVHHAIAVLFAPAMSAAFFVLLMTIAC